MTLPRPWLAFDLEATGPNADQDRITEIAIVDAFDTQRVLYQAFVNPEKHIPADVEHLTKITNEMAAIAPRFKFLAEDVANILHGAILVGFGCNQFDVLLLANEFDRAEVDFDWASVTVIDVGSLYKLLKPRTLTAAVREYLGRDHAGAHGALVDTSAAAEVLLAMQQVHPDHFELKSSCEIETLARHGQVFADPPFGKLLRNPDGYVVFNTAKNRSVRVIDDVGYAKWMLRQEFFRDETKRAIQAELDRLAKPKPSLFAGVGATDTEGGRDDIPF